MTFFLPDPAHFPQDADYGDMLLQDEKLDADDTEFESFHKYIGAEFFVNNNDGDQVPAKVVKCARDNEGNVIGQQHSNPLLDTHSYDSCELGDGTVYRYDANVIAENIFAQWDDEGRQQAVLQEITDHRIVDTTVHISNGYATTNRGRRIPKTTTKGWQL